MAVPIALVLTASVVATAVAATGAAVASTAPDTSSSSPLSAAPSNVCVTEYGVCPVTPPGTTRGAPCECLVPPATVVPGIAEYWVQEVPRLIP